MNERIRAGSIILCNRISPWVQHHCFGVRIPSLLRSSAVDAISSTRARAAERSGKHTTHAREWIHSARLLRRYWIKYRAQLYLTKDSFLADKELREGLTVLLLLIRSGHPETAGWQRRSHAIQYMHFLCTDTFLMTDDSLAVDNMTSQWMLWFKSSMQCCVESVRVNWHPDDRCPKKSEVAWSGRKWNCHF